MQEEFSKEKEVLKAKFESSRIYLQKYVENVQKDLEDELIKRNRDKANFNLRLNSIEENLKVVRKNFNDHERSFESYAEALGWLIEINQINLAMEMQDEIDREKLALMGYKEETVKGTNTLGASKSKQSLTESNNPYVTLDKQCLTCSGQSSVVLKAFKIACLTYKPSPVDIPEMMIKNYPRLDLISLKSKIIKDIEKLSLPKPVKTQQVKTMTTSLFNTRHPKVVIKSDVLSSPDYTGPVSQHDIRRKNITMLSDKTDALARNPFNDSIPMQKTLQVHKKKKDNSKDMIGPQVMSLPRIKRGNQTAR
jgi:hypothetical protein